MNSEEVKYKWKEVYSYVIPTILTILYMIYVILVEVQVVPGKLIQYSKYFHDMLEILVTFMSIILSVFGFLIPSFLSSKGESDTINYFLKYADMRLFAAKLKNVVAVGLTNIFMTSILLLTDIFSNYVIDVVIIVWLWMMFFFMCSSYRFISLMINLLMTQKKKVVQEIANKISDEEKEELHKNIRSI